ncbi:M50 family metallopeptidase [Arthrobacter pascens]|uniref:M50 family metallopeptidase n=1 Tax=Arthrobacter pascens TaxID=1677 RepID=UPI00196A6F3D|nr:M50 family metallopeptidase [Arthrobacter pascens]MBN3496798.1 M50 family metallopeptidase [Arthrobacter pascens]
MVNFAAAVPTLPEQWWDRVAAGFARSEVPTVTVTELLAVVLVAVVLSVPGATWRYFGLFATVTHELGHAFAALTSGQRLGGIKLRLNHSGTTTSYTRGRFAAVWSGFWGYPVPGMTGAGLVWSGFNGWGPAAMSAGLLVLLASLIFIRNAAGVLILLAAVAGTGALIIGVPAVFTGHVAIILGLALLVASVRDLAKLANVHLRRRDQLRTSDAYILYRATAVPSAVWIALFSLVVAASWLVAWQPMSRVLAAGT